jgi:hypothetical protein
MTGPWPDADPSPRVLLGLAIVWLGATIAQWIHRVITQPPDDES